MDYLNASNINDLRQLVIEGKPIAAFIGAGCSSALKIPQWKEMLIQLNEEFNFYGSQEELIRDIQKSGYPAVASKIQNSASDIDRYKELLKRQASPVACHFTSLHLELIKLSKLIVTTNYDQSFEETFSALKRFDPKNVLTYETSSLGDFNYDGWGVIRHIFHIHGEVNSGEMILTTESYEEQYNSPDSGLSHLISVITSRYTTVFVGFSFDDAFFTGFLNKTLKALRAEKERYNKPFPKHYCIMSDKLQVDYLTAAELSSSKMKIDTLLEEGVIKLDSESMTSPKFRFNADTEQKLQDAQLPVETRDYLLSAMRKFAANREKLALLKELGIEIIHFEGENYLQIEFILRKLNETNLVSAEAFNPFEH